MIKCANVFKRFVHFLYNKSILCYFKVGTGVGTHAKMSDSCFQERGFLLIFLGKIVYSFLLCKSCSFSILVLPVVNREGHNTWFIPLAHIVQNSHTGRVVEGYAHFGQMSLNMS